METKTDARQTTTARRAGGRARRALRRRPSWKGGSAQLLRWGIVAACAAVVLSIAGARVALGGPAPSCVVIDDQGHCGDFTSVTLDGPHYAQQVSRATIGGDLAEGGYTAEGGWNVNPPPCRMRNGQCVPNVCYRTGGDPLKTRWGYFPTGQVVYEDRVWCGYLNWYQTYRASRLRTGTGGAGSICHADAPQYKYKTAGGNGYFSTSVHTGSHFSCSVPGVPVGFQDFQVWNCNMAGYCHEANWGHE